jgi:hypothetical protein
MRKKLDAGFMGSPEALRWTTALISRPGKRIRCLKELMNVEDQNADRISGYNNSQFAGRRWRGGAN